MNYGLEQIGALTTAWLSLFFIAASVFGSICALGAAWAARWFVRRPTSSAPTAWPDVSILKPLSGVEAQLSENIETYLNQDYAGKIQVIFGVQDPDDSAIPVVKSLIAAISRARSSTGRQRRHAWRQPQSLQPHQHGASRSPSAHRPGRQRHCGRSKLLAHVSRRAGAAGRRRGHLPLSRGAEWRLLVATVRHGGA